MQTILIEEKPLFPVGRVVLTVGASESITEPHAGFLLIQHMFGNFGDICAEDKETNLDNIKHGGRVLSSFKINDTESVWIITESDFSTTTILLPSEY